jgi:hypothetical protein
MGMGKVKGRIGNEKEIRSLASAATLVVPNVGSQFQLTGTTAISAIDSGPVRAGRQITLLGPATSTITLTGTAISGATSGQIALAAASRSLANQDVTILEQNASGVWLEASFNHVI